MKGLFLFLVALLFVSPAFAIDLGTSFNDQKIAINFPDVPQDKIIRKGLQLSESTQIIAVMKDGKNREYYLVRDGSIRRGYMSSVYTLIEKTKSTQRSLWRRVFEMDGVSGGCGRGKEIGVNRGLVKHELKKIEPNKASLGAIKISLSFENCETEANEKETLGFTLFTDSILIEEYPF